MNAKEIEQRSSEISYKEKTMKTRDDIKVRLIDNNGSKTWIYDGIKPAIKRGMKKHKDTEESFKDYVLSKINNPPKNDVVENVNPPKNESVRPKVKFRWVMPKSNIKCRSIKSENNIQRSGGDSFDIFSYDEES